METHRFRTIVAQEAYSPNREFWDTPLFESESFIALPSVGALVPGWLLVVPRNEILSFAQLPARLFWELERFVEGVVFAVQAQFGPVALFEHGASRPTSAVGCGVDYAHLHIVPVAIDLKAGAERIAPHIGWQSVSSIRDIQRLNSTDEYWLVQQPYGATEAFIGLCSAGSSPSQLFRRVIATALGKPAAYDWKQTSGADNIAATVEALAPPLVSA